MATSYENISLGHLADHLIYLTSSSSFWFSLNFDYDRDFHLSKRLGMTPKDSSTSLVKGSPSPFRPHPFRHMLPLLVNYFFHLYGRLGGEPTGEPTRDDLMVDKAGTKTSYYSSGGALIASRRPPLQHLVMIGCCVLC